MEPNSLDIYPEVTSSTEMFFLGGGVINDTGSVDYIALDARVTDWRWIWKDFERSSHGIIVVLLPVSAWKDWGNPWKASVMIPGVLAWESNWASSQFKPKALPPDQLVQFITRIKAFTWLCSTCSDSAAIAQPVKWPAIGWIAKVQFPAQIDSTPCYYIQTSSKAQPGG